MNQTPPAVSQRPKIVLLAIGLAIFTVIAPAAHAQGTAAPIYEFTGGADGGDPIGGVVQDASGTFYGETSVGGGVACTSKAGQPSGGCGTVYSFNSKTGVKVLASFSGPNGAYGLNTLTLSGSTLYGNTLNGGANDDGVVFSVKTDGTSFTILHQFSGTDGQSPGGIIRMGSGGILYGIAEFGGAHNYGVLFSIKPDGTYTVLHNFAGGSKDGSYPYTLLISSTGTLVGSTENGGKRGPFCPQQCGTIFQYIPSTGAYSVPYLFNGETSSGGALGGVIGSIGPGPTVYGNGYGSPYSVSEATGLVDIGYFQVSEPAYTSGPLLTKSGSLIGVVGEGNPLSFGTLYSAANNTVTTLYNFLGSFGYNPLAQPIVLPSGNIIGTASLGGLCADCGAIWQYTP
jgi:uncharacterized repeat protein (TIGR03803 family)